MTTLLATLAMLERREVITTDPAEAADCCGMPRDEDGFCIHRPGHPIYVDTLEVMDRREFVPPPMNEFTVTVQPGAANPPEVEVPEINVVTGPLGFTETFDAHTVETLVRLGLIRHARDGYVLEDGSGNGVGALHHFYEGAGQ